MEKEKLGWFDVELWTFIWHMIKITLVDSGLVWWIAGFYVLLFAVLVWDKRDKKRAKTLSNHSKL